MGFAGKDTHELAVTAFKAGGHTQQEVTAIFGIHYKTLASWLKAEAQGRQQCPRPKGHLKRILDAEDLAKIDRIVASDPSITVPELMCIIGKICSLGVYSRALKELGYTFKKTFRASEQDREDIKDQRAEWRQWSRDCQRARLIFIYESTAGTDITPLRGWARKRCFGSRPGPWKTITLLSFLKFNGSTDGLVIDGSCDKDAFREFMETGLLPQTRKGDVVIMENARIHKKSFDVALFEKMGVEIKYLPPYSPDLNPIEKMWSKIKSIMRQLRPRTFNEIWLRSSEAHLEVTDRCARMV